VDGQIRKVQLTAVPAIDGSRAWLQIPPSLVTSPLHSANPISSTAAEEARSNMEI
jgi:hypothetical protein